MLEITRTNTILYCDRWADTVAFYTDTLGLAVTHTTDWFVEVHLTATGHLSIADSSRATISPGHGAGLTLSWQVVNVTTTQAALMNLGLSVSDVASRWNSSYIELHDPEGNRIELWSEVN